MYISRFQVYNYESFHRPRELEFKPGFNVIVGQNDAGKTALLQAIGLNLSLNPHRSLRTLPDRGSTLDVNSWADLTVCVTAAELRELVRGSRSAVLIPLPELNSESSRRIGYSGDDTGSLQTLAELINNRETFEFAFRNLAVQGGSNLLPRPSPSLGLYEARRAGGQTQIFVGLTLAENGQFRAGRLLQGGGAHIVPLVATLARQRIYSFSAERLNVGRSNIKAEAVLSPNAENLAQVLHALQGNNPPKFRRFNSLVHSILPHVSEVTTSLVGTVEVEVRVWKTDPANERDDLAVPLSQCGTGIGQVLAMLYVAVNSDFPQVVIIDEPQSFLHPGAVRKLMEILRGFRQHQFIIATHSPAVITATSPETITLVRLQDGESVLEPIDADDTRSLRLSLAEVGARLSDVFGADNILWVEGETEEICFPKILEKLAGRPLMGTVVVGVAHTGDLERRHAERVLEIYERLSKGQSLLPPAIGFLFDLECRSQQEQRELKHRGNGLVHFLRRRMFENYLLNSNAIAATVNRIDNFRSTPVSAEEIDHLIRDKRANPRCYCPANTNPNADRWMYDIDAAKVLREIFSELSETRVAFDKLRHSVALAEWLIDNAPGDLAEIKELLLEILGRKD
jgi:predicted ATPase